MGKIQHKPSGSEAIYFTSIMSDNETSKRGLNQEMLIRFCVGDIVGVSIRDSIPHCHTEMLSKGANIKKCGFVSILWKKLEYLASIVFHTVIMKML